MNTATKALFSIFLTFSLIASLKGMENSEVEHVVLETPVKIELEHLNIENARTQEDFQEWLDQENLKMWKKLEAFYGINQNQCHELKQEHNEKYKALVQDMVNNDRVDVELSKDLKTLIMGVIKDFGCDEDRLEIVPFAKRNPAGSTDEKLFINPDCIPAPMPLEVKKYVVAIAVAMALNGDHSTDYELAFIRQSNNMQQSEELSKVMEDYETLKVVRADMKAMLLGAEYRNGQTMYLQRLMNQYGDAADKSDVARYIIGQLMKKALN